MQALATLMTGAHPIARWGSDELKQELLPGVASGELLLTAAIREPSDPQPDLSATTITNGKLTGTKIGVPYAEQSRLVLVPSSMIMASSGQIATKTGHDHGVALLDPHAPGVELTRTPSSSGEPECTLRMDQAPVEGMLGGADCVRDLYQLATAGACALADGAVAGAETVLDLLGPDGAAESEASGEFLLTRCLSIAGGTTQVLLNQVAERVLGLPR